MQGIFKISNTTEAVPKKAEIQIRKPDVLSWFINKKLKFITKINCLTTNLYLYFYNKVVSYKDKLDLIISSEKCDNIITNVSDSISIKQGEKTCTFKSPTTAGDDYWVIQHYKTKKILNVSPQER